MAEYNFKIEDLQFVIPDYVELTEEQRELLKRIFELPDGVHVHIGIAEPLRDETFGGEAQSSRDVQEENLNEFIREAYDPDRRIDNISRREVWVHYCAALKRTANAISDLCEYCGVERPQARAHPGD